MNDSLSSCVQCLRRSSLGFWRLLAVFGLIPLMGGLLQATPINVYVSPTGNDTTGNGSSGTPWATINKARTAIQSMSHADDIIVNVRAGEYVLSSPIYFSVADSGGSGHSVIYQSVDGIGAATLVGAAKLPTTGWTSLGNSKWAILLGATNTVPLGTLYENGTRSWLARQPNYVPSLRYPLARGGYSLSTSGGQGSGSDWLVYLASDFSAIDPATWTLGASSSVVWWQAGGTPCWGNDAPPQLTSVNTGSTQFFCHSVSTDPAYIPSTERFFINGVPQLLDANGEYFYDATSGTLTYRTVDGTTPNNASKDIRAPLATQLINLTGTGVTGHIHDIQFIGFKVAYTNNKGLGGTDGAFTFQSTDHIAIQNCEIAEVGGLAIAMRNDNAYNTISGCWIHNCGTGGIIIVDQLARSTTPAPNTSSNHWITNCKINDLGELYVSPLYTAGVLLWSTQNSQVDHCDISRSARYGTSLRGNYSTQVPVHDLGYNNSVGNTFSYLRVTDCLMDSGDAGEVHAAECNATGGTNINFWSQIMISGAYADPSMHDIAPNGIFLDHPDSCENQNFSNVEIGWVQSTLPFRTNVNPDQTLDNVSALPDVSGTLGTFDPSRMDYAHIGLGGDFPFELQSDDPENPLSTNPTVIADDHTGDYQEFGTGWVDSAISGLHDGDGRYHVAATGTNYAEWSPRLPFTGTYQVYAWQMGTDANASAQVPFTVYHNAGNTTVPVNQQTGTAQTWVSLGSYRFAAGFAPQSGFIQLSANTPDQKAVRADAVKFVLQGSPLAVIGDEKGWWTLNNTLCDDAGYLLTGTAMPVGSGPTFVSGGGSGGVVSCMTFDGVDDYVNVPDAPGLNIATGDFAISVWFYRTTNSAGNLRILSKGAGLDTQKGYAIYGGDTGLTVAVGNGTTRKYASCNHSALNNWNHLVVNIARSGSLSLYLNGVLQSGAVDISAWNGVDLTANPAVPLNIGRNVNVGQYWTGKIGAVRVFQRVLTQAEITKLAANP